MLNFKKPRNIFSKRNVNKIEKVLVPASTTKWSKAKTLIDVDELEIPKNVFNSFKVLKSHGFLLEKENRIFFPYALDPDSNFDFFIIYSTEDYLTSPTLRVDLGNNLIRTGAPVNLWLQETQFTEFSEKIHKPFAHHKFTPKNGWGHIHYLNYLNSWSNPDQTWSKDEIKTLDKYKSLGVSSNLLWLLLTSGISIPELQEKVDDPDFKDFLNLPKDWIRRSLNI